MLQRLLPSSSSYVLLSNLRRFCNGANPKKGSKKIIDHFEKSGQMTNLELFPADLKRVSRKKDQQIYVANEHTAHQIANLIKRFHRKNVPFVELSPGPCILSKALLDQLDMETLVLIQTNNEFATIQQQLHEMHPSKVHLRAANAKWNFNKSIRDKIFQFCEQREWCDDVVFQLFFHSKLEDLQRLNFEVIRQCGFFAYGRVEIFTIMSSLDFLKLTAGPSSPYVLYTYFSCLSQILFEWEQLAEFPVDDFLPWHSPKPGFGGKVEHNTNALYLIRLTPKKNLFSLCKRDDLPVLQFFVYQCFFKRKGFIIPKLENWFPDIGIDLITEHLNQTISTQIHANNEENLLEHLTNKFEVFTKCGSLTPLEMCALFQFVRHSPKYKDSSFHEQYNKFFAQRSIRKQSTTSIISSDGQLNGNDDDSGEYSNDSSHKKNS